MSESMNYDFYNHISGRRSVKTRALVPAQRLLRRLLRPIFFRLRDIVQYLSDRQQSQNETLTQTITRLNALEEQHIRLAYAHQALIQDHMAASRRVVMLEDLILQTTIDQSTNTNENWNIIPIRKSDHGLSNGIRKAS